MKGVRYIYSGEPEIGEKINAARMKQLSGDDVVGARALHSDQDKLKIMGRIFMACNDLPPITSMDGGTWRRLVVINFVSKFVLNPVAPNEYPLDESIQFKVVIVTGKQIGRAHV